MLVARGEGGDVVANGPAAVGWPPMRTMAFGVGGGVFLRWVSIEAVLAGRWGRGIGVPWLRCHRGRNCALRIGHELTTTAIGGVVRYPNDALNEDSSAHGST